MDIPKISIIDSLRGKRWRNVQDYRITYRENYVEITAYLINKNGDNFVGVVTAMNDCVSRLTGTDEIIYHKNLLDLWGIRCWLSDPTNKALIEYIELMLKHPYDIENVCDVLERSERK